MKAFKNLLRPVLCGIAIVSLGQPASSPAAVYNVSVLDDYFSPSAINISAGDTVIWTWVYSYDGHNVVSTSTPYAWLFPSPDGGPGTPSDQSNVNTENTPYAFTNVFTSDGTFPYECTLHAEDGMEGSVTVTGTPPVPTVAITNPAAGQVFAAPANLAIEASTDDSASVTNVQFLVGTAILTNCPAAPFFAITNNLPAGAYTLSAIATDMNGLTATQSITVSVVANPVLTGTRAFVSNRIFQFSYSTTAGLNYLVQGSGNLSSWTSLATNAATTNSETFIATNAIGKAGFYRVELMPNP